MWSECFISTINLNNYPGTRYKNTILYNFRSFFAPRVTPWLVVSCTVSSCSAVGCHPPLPPHCTLCSFPILIKKLNSSHGSVPAFVSCRCTSRPSTICHETWICPGTVLRNSLGWNKTHTHTRKKKKKKVKEKEENEEERKEAREEERMKDND